MPKGEMLRDAEADSGSAACDSQRLATSPKLHTSRTYLVRPTLLHDLHERFQLQWLDEAPVSLVAVKEDENEEGTCGLLTTSPAEHSYQLRNNNIISYAWRLRVRAGSSAGSRSNPEQLDNVLDLQSPL